MSVSLPTNKEEKRARYEMLVKQGVISNAQAVMMYRQYLHNSKSFNKK